MLEPLSSECSQACALSVGLRENFEIVMSDAEWRRQLGPAEYAILRDQGTERPGSSPLNGEKRPGRFACAGCDLPLFSSEAKFESGTGWLSF